MSSTGKTGSRNQVSASAPPYIHIGVHRTLCFKLSLTGLQDQFGPLAKKIFEPQLNSLAQTSSSTCALSSTLHSYSLLLRPRTHLILQFLLMKAMTIMLFYTLIQTLLCARHHFGYFKCMNKFDLHSPRW